MNNSKRYPCRLCSTPRAIREYGSLCGATCLRQNCAGCGGRGWVRGPSKKAWLTVPAHRLIQAIRRVGVSAVAAALGMRRFARSVRALSEHDEGLRELLQRGERGTAPAVEQEQPRPARKWRFPP